MTARWQAVPCKLITPVVIATSQNCHFLLVFTATFLLCRVLNWVRTASKISAGGVGSPYNQL